MAYTSLAADTLAFTFCQVPFVYHIDENNLIRITHADGTWAETEGLEMNAFDSNEIFNRTALVKQVDVYLTPGLE